MNETPSNGNPPPEHKGEPLLAITLGGAILFAIFLGGELGKGADGNPIGVAVLGALLIAVIWLFAPRLFPRLSPWVVALIMLPVAAIMAVPPLLMITLLVLFLAGVFYLIMRWVESSLFEKWEAPLPLVQTEDIEIRDRFVVSQILIVGAAVVGITLSLSIRGSCPTFTHPSLLTDRFAVLLALAFALVGLAQFPLRIALGLDWEERRAAAMRLQRGFWRLWLSAAIFCLIVGGLLKGVGMMVHPRTKAKCLGAQKNRIVAIGELENELAAVKRGRALGREVDAADAVQNVLWRHTGVGACVELVPGWCERAIANDERSPFMPDLPSMSGEMAAMEPCAGQVVLIPLAGREPQVIVWQDLSGHANCGEAMPVGQTVGAKDIQSSF